MQPFPRRAAGAVFVGVCAATVRKNGISDARGARALLCVGLLLACSSMAASAGAQTFVGTNLGTLGGTISVANALNVSGQVVGYSTTAGDAATHAFSWTPGGAMVDLGTLGGTTSAAAAVNVMGEVVGFAYIANANPL